MTRNIDRLIDLLWDNIYLISISISVLLYSVAIYIILVISLYALVKMIIRLRSGYSRIVVIKITLITLFCLSIISWTSTAVQSSLRIYLPKCSNGILVLPYLALLGVALSLFVGYLRKNCIFQLGITVIASMKLSLYIMVLYILISITVSAATHQVDKLWNNSYPTIHEFTERVCFAITNRKPDYSWVASGSDYYSRLEKNNNNSSIEEE